MEDETVHGERVPAIGLGTYQLRGRDGVEAITRALDVGYRHLDTAELYENETIVGRAVGESAVAREDVFLTTKVWKTNLAREDVLASGRRSAEKLGVDTIDLLLIHAPGRSVPISETVEAMNDLQAEGTVRHVGVSNFSVDQLRKAMAASDTPVLTNQVEYHPYEDRSELLEFCIENDVLLTAYSPLAKGRPARDETLAAIGERYGKSAAQVALRWLVQQPSVVAIPKASRKGHLRENLDVFDFSLTDAEMERITELGGGTLDRLRSLLDR
jgi:diketogulonate reductase-like aldo/keto reductase